jgi:hypothetical protein
VALRSAERSFSLEARALNVSPYVSLRPGILASGSAAARLDGLPRTKWPSCAVLFGAAVSTALAGPAPRRGATILSPVASRYAGVDVAVAQTRAQLHPESPALA